MCPASAPAKFGWVIVIVVSRGGDERRERLVRAGLRGGEVTDALLNEATSSTGELGTSKVSGAGAIAG